MRGCVRAAVLWLAATATIAAGSAQQRAPDEPDVFARRGVYAETDRGLIELKVYAEGRALNDTIFDGTMVKAYRYRIEPTKPVPRAGALASFVVNEPGTRAEAWMATAQLVFVVGREVEQGTNAYFPMTTKVTKLRASVYHVISPELQGAWMRECYEKGRTRFGSELPEAFVGLLVQESSGQPRRLYPVQLFP